VQWGAAYGIANRTGRPSLVQIGAMLRRARKAHVALLDTAHGYGDAERILGELHAETAGFRVFTKTRSLTADRLRLCDVESVVDAFRESLARLRRSHVEGLLVHNPDNLLVPGGDRLWAALCKLRADGLAQRIGVSVYHPGQLTHIIERFQLDVAQIPFSIYDQRFAQRGLLSELKKSGVEVHARGVFLQGIMVLPPHELPQQFDSIRDHQARLHRCLLDKGQRRVPAALQFALNQPELDVVIVGTETASQLDEILDSARAPDADLTDLTSFALTDETILDPSRWSL
jgi:aryl-alcohol dehydrogenase-like predicted oxidoreductase